MMVPSDRLLGFAAAAFVLIVIPGPSVLFEISRSIALGRRAGLATVAGNAAGEMVQAVAVAIGIGSIIQRSEPLFTVVKVIGVTKPKSLVFFAAVLPQFVVVQSGFVAAQLAVLGFVLLLIALLSDSAWVFVAGTARDWFARSQRRLEVVGGAGGLR